ncbi:MAG: hypothetical protein LBK62_13375 [Treponema sp.]|jgi:hypothetical protein|nr:hypothetical protein [Treponema sp.]
MKKLLFLFLVVMMVVAGLMAAPVHPPEVATPDTVLFGYELIAVTPDTVLTVAPFIRQPGQVLPLPVIMTLKPGMARNNQIIAVIDIGRRPSVNRTQPVDFPLLC